MSLWNLKKGQMAKISGYNEDTNKEYLTRLMDLGFRENVHIKCLTKPGLGAPGLFKIHNIVFSLDDQIAKKILVTIEDLAPTKSEEGQNE